MLTPEQPLYSVTQAGGARQQKIQSNEKKSSHPNYRELVVKPTSPLVVLQATPPLAQAHHPSPDTSRGATWSASYTLATRTALTDDPGRLPKWVLTPVPKR